MSTTKLIFIYSNSKFKVTCKTNTLNSGTSELILKKNVWKFSYITFPILHHFASKFHLNCHPEYLWIYFSWWNHQIRLMVHSSLKNTQCTVRQSQVYYLHTTNLGPLWQYSKKMVKHPLLVIEFASILLLLGCCCCCCCCCCCKGRVYSFQRDKYRRGFCMIFCQIQLTFDCYCITLIFNT